jgi:hypothetical protein
LWDFRIRWSWRLFCKHCWVQTQSPPTIPTNLTASGTTASSTNLSWTASTDDEAVTGYNIYNGSEMVALLVELDSNWIKF